MAERAKRVKASRSFIDFVRYTKPDYQVNWHHEALADKLQAFAEGRIKRLMVFMPPQHGKSELVSRRLPAYLLGRNPQAKVIGCSYSSDLATSFNRDVQRIIDNRLYANVFPDTRLNGSNVRTTAQGSFLRNADIFEVVGHRGFYKSVGLGGSLTGTPADIGIIDDPVKDAVEAESPTYRARAWDWYTNVFLTRMHNDSQILITQTRWHEDDLSGRILAKEKGWEVLSLPAINEHGPSGIDHRMQGEALWPERHSLERLLEMKRSNEKAFKSLYQQDPQPHEGGLVFPSWSFGWCDDGLHAFGLDFGFEPDPVALVEVRISGKTLFVKEHIYRNRMTPDDIVRDVKAIVPRGVPVYCDHRTDIIEMMYRAGINAKKADKGKDSIDTGLRLVQQHAMNVSEGSHNLVIELKSYSYQQDRDGNPIGGVPKPGLDHAIDAMRYAVAGIVVVPVRKPFFAPTKA